MAIDFNLLPFRTADGTHDRTISDWWGDTICAAEFANLNTTGTFGAGTGDDSPVFQRVLDLAFHNYGGTPGGTPTGVPHGLDYAHLNRPIYIPNGRYTLLSTLVMEKVVGGHIYGAGRHSTRLNFGGYPGTPGALLPTLYMNGCSDVCIEGMGINNGGSGGAYLGTNTCCIFVDWDEDDSGNGCDGNHGNHFQELNIGGGEYVVVVGRTGSALSGGQNTLFINCNAAAPGALVGYDVRGPEADITLVAGGANYISNGVGVRCPAGGGSAYIQGIAGTGNGDVDYLMESGKVMHIGQLRSESVGGAMRMENGIVTLDAVTNGSTVCVEINGGVCNLHGNALYPGGQITGTGGELLLWGNYFGVATTPLSGYSGTVVWNPQDVAS